MMVNPAVRGSIFRRGVVIFAIAPAWHRDRRLQATEASNFESFYPETSLVPLVAILRGGSASPWRKSAAARKTGEECGWRGAVTKETPRIDCFRGTAPEGMHPLV
jgi:hypothetical protein